MRNILLSNFKSRLEKTISSMSLIGIAILLSGMTLQAQEYTVSKSVLGVEESSVSGHINVLYQVTFTNVNELPGVTDIALTDDAEFFIGAGYSGVASLPTIVSSNATIRPNVNGAFQGNAADPNLLDGSSGFMIPGQYVTIAYSLEIDPSQISGDVMNTVYANAALTSGGTSLGQIVASATLMNCWDNCVMACNNQVNISVNSTCEAEVLAEMFLEGENEQCAALGFFKVEIFDLNDNPVALPIPSLYIGQRLKAVITNIACGNTCWANLLVEDKTAPVLTCKEVTVDCDESISPYNPLIGFPVPLANITATTDPNVFIASSVDACGDATLSYRDSLVIYDCNNPILSSTIYRKWTATDISGLMVMCWDTINFIRGTIADIDLPPHYDGQSGNESELDCDGSFCRLPNGFPAPTDCGTGAPSGLFCGNIQFDYEDDTIKVCDGTYKLFRKWIIIDWCDPDNKVEYVQRIKVHDVDGPIVIAPPRTPLVLTMDGWDCSRATYLVPEPVFDTTGQNAADYPYIPTIVDECSSWTYEVQTLSVDQTIKDPNDCANVDPNQIFNTQNVRKLANGRYELFDLPAGCNWIKYIITDDCGNSTTFSFDLFIEDNVAPIAVCHEHTVVSLTSDGKARVYASTFDDGSHDNCALGNMQVRRMSNGPCPSGVIDDTNFRDYVEFCCEDISRSPVMVVLRVWDECGNNYSECMVEVTVQDKLPPRIVSCPGPVVITCEDDYTTLSQFGNAEATDNCNVQVTSTADYDISDCGVGTITRTFTATDDGGLQATCTQVITIVDQTPFTVNDIKWPDNKMIMNGCMADTDPDQTDKPEFLNEDDCNQIATSYEDLVFSQVDGSCLKILRKWKVVDWCQFDRTRPKDCYPDNVGQWCYTQVIKVVDVRGPQITSDCSDRELCITGSNCSVSGTFEATAFDSCTISSHLIWHYTLDLNNDGTVDNSGNRNRFTQTYYEGVHKITWTVEDQCGNTDTCSYLVTVLDCKNPTPYCKPGITTVVMPTTGSIELWASDFNDGSYDNCTDAEDLIYSFSSNPNERNKVFTCDSITNGVSDTIKVTIYVWDETGNHDYCVTNLILQDPQDVCPDVLGSTGMIAGLVSNLNTDKMRDVAVLLGGASMPSGKTIKTDDDGKYAFPDITMYNSYVVKPRYNEDHLNGVSTLDLVMIQRHLLGLTELQTPYQYIAADVNSNEEISTSDISELRKLILGKYAELPNNTAWRFVDKSYQFPNPKSPFPFKEEIKIDDLTKDDMDNDFLAVKVGDVSGDALGSGITNNSTRGGFVDLQMGAVDQYGTQIVIPVKSSQAMETYGFQFTLEYNVGKLDFDQLTGAGLPFDHQDYALISQEEGIVTVSWMKAEGVHFNENEVLFYLVFETSQASFDPSWLKVSDAVTRAELYDVEGNTWNVRLGGDSNGMVSGYALHQNTPNPFAKSTTIGFDLPGPIEYSLEVFDMSGKVLKVIEGLGYKGYQSIEIDLSGISETGVLYYQLNTDAFTATRKMVIIE